jgi:hypothetical protein
MTALVDEEAAVPDGDSLLHPLDVPDARRCWLRGWVLRRAAGPAALLSLIGLAFIPNVSALAVLAVPPLVWAALSVGAWRLTHVAWNVIPQERWEPAPRPAPPRWALWYAGGSAVVTIVVGVSVVLYGLGPDPAGHTAAFVTGGLSVYETAGVVRLGYRAARRQWRQVVVALPSLGAGLALVFVAELGLPHGGRGLRGDLFSGAEAVTAVYLFLRGVTAVARSRRWRRDPAAGPPVLTSSADDPPPNPVRKRRKP